MDLLCGVAGRLFRRRRSSRLEQPSTLKATAVNELHRITTNPEICGGRPCIRGLRIRVKDVLDLLAAGASREEVLEDYPYLVPEDIVAVLQYAARQSDNRVLLVA